MVTALAIVAAAVIVALGSSGSDSPTKADSAARRPAPAASVPQSADPAEQARALADFLRAQSR